MSYAHLNDGTVYHFPRLNGLGQPIDVPPDADLLRVVAEARLSSLPMFVKSLVRGAAKHNGKPRYEGVNRARLVLARASLDRLVAEETGRRLTAAEARARDAERQAAEMAAITTAGLIEALSGLATIEQRIAGGKSHPTH